MKYRTIRYRIFMYTVQNEQDLDNRPLNTTIKTDSRNQCWTNVKLTKNRNLKEKSLFTWHFYS